MIQRAAILGLLAGLPVWVEGGGLLPSAVDSVTSGTANGFGASFLPGNVLSGPDGGPSPPNVPNENATDLYSLGVGGQIVLRWDLLRTGPKLRR